MKHLIFALIGLALTVGSFQFDAAGLATHPALTFLMVTSLMIGMFMMLLAVVTPFIKATPVAFVKAMAKAYPALCSAVVIYGIATFTWGSLWEHSVLSAQTLEVGRIALVSIGFFGLIAFVLHDFFSSKRQQVTPIA